MKVLFFIYSKLVLITIALYILFNYGFMQTRMYISGNFSIPVGELVLILGLLLCNYKKILREKIFILFGVWWVYTAVLLVFDVGAYGVWALRDASHVLESMYVLIGFTFIYWFKDKIFIDYFRFYKTISIVVLVYALLYIARDSLVVYSPRIISGAGYDIPIFFHYLNTSFILLSFSTMLLLLPSSNKLILIIFSAAILTYVLLVFPSRTLYLQIICVLLFVFWKSKRKLILFSFVPIAIFVLLWVNSLLGTEVKSRTGVVVNAEYILNHFLSISGIGRGEVEGSAAGVSLRLNWWVNIFGELTKSIKHFFFGLGYGEPLVNFAASGKVYVEGGQIVREPHNSYISIFARGGFVAAILWVSTQVTLIIYWQWLYKNLVEFKYRIVLNLIMVYSICIWVLAIGQDAFEKPFNAIPFYFQWGLIIGMKSLIKDSYRFRAKPQHT
jgi:hypothetical protein